MGNREPSAFLKILWLLIVVLGVVVAVVVMTRNENERMNGSKVVGDVMKDRDDSRPMVHERAPLELGAKVLAPSVGRRTSPADSKITGRTTVGLRAGSGSTADSKSGTLANEPPKATPHLKPKDAVMARREFRKRAETVYRDLPTMISMSGLSNEEAHGVPAAIRQAGEKLADVAQMLSEDPRLSHDGVQFYTHCFQNSTFVPQVRALCLNDARRWRKLSALDQDKAEDLTGVPRQVIDLASLIPD